MLVDTWDDWEDRLENDEKLLVQCAVWSKGGASMDQIERWPRSKLIRRLRILSDMNAEEAARMGGHSFAG